MSISETWPSLGRSVAPLVESLIARARALRVNVSRSESGATLVDAGIGAPGGLEAGVLIAEICMGGLGRVNLEAGGLNQRWPFAVTVRASDPVPACLASQYAGWSLSHGEGKGAFFALGSGPGRAMAVKEELFKELGYRDEGDTAVFVLEVDKVPPEPLIERVAKDCGVKPEGLTFILTPTQSLAGTVQIVARVLEVAMHKVHALDFPLEQVADGIASAPLPPPAPDFIKAMGRTNDAIIYGGWVQLFVRGDAGAAKELARRLPSGGSRNYGKPFAETFAEVKGDFYAIDPMLFSPARVTVTALDSGESFHAGALDAALVDSSFS